MDAANEFRMPSLGADMETGTLVEWQVAAGDSVHRGQVVAVVETDKGAMDVEVWHDGIVKELLVPAGTTVPVGTLLATLRAPDAAAPAPSAPVPAAPGTSPPVRATPIPLRASPAARRLAHERGVDLGALAGSGPSGAIALADIERASHGAPPSKPASAFPSAITAASCPSTTW